MNFQVSRFSVSFNGNFMAYSQSDEIRVGSFPMSGGELDAIGPEMNKKYEYISYILKILKGEKFVYDKK